MQQIVNDDLIPLGRAPELFPANARPNASTIWRWATVGLRGKKLRTTRIGDRIYCSEEAVREFVTECDGDG